MPAVTVNEPRGTVYDEVQSADIGAKPSGAMYRTVKIYRIKRHWYAKLDGGTSYLYHYRYRLYSLINDVTVTLLSTYEIVDCE